MAISYSNFMCISTDIHQIYKNSNQNIWIINRPQSRSRNNSNNHILHSYISYPGLKTEKMSNMRSNI